MVIFPFGFYILQGKRTIYGQPPRLERTETVRAYGAYRVRLAGRLRSAGRSERYRHFAIGQVGLITRWTRSRT